MRSPQELSLHISAANEYARIKEVLICDFEFKDELSDEAPHDPQFVGMALLEDPR